MENLRVTVFHSDSQLSSRRVQASNDIYGCSINTRDASLLEEGAGGMERGVVWAGKDQRM